MSGEKLTREELAVDYVLGMAEGTDLERAERLMATDGLFKALVMTWRETLGEMNRTAPEVPVRHLMWEGVQNALATVPGNAVKPAHAVASNAGHLSSLWQNLGFWRPAALAGGLATVLLAAGLVQEQGKPPAQPVYVAVLQTELGRASAVVNAYADGTVTLVPIETIGVPEGRILEVWTLQTRERGPVSIGRMGRARTLKLDLKQLSRPDAGHLFEITVEPPGGSPTGRPTGPILMKGLAGQAL